MNELMSLPSSPHFFLSDDPSSPDQQQQTDQPPEADNDDAMSDNNTEDMEKIQQMLKAYWDYHPSVAQRNIGAREVDDTESTFNVTSFRPGMGVERLRDEEPATFWQSNVSPSKKDRAVNITFNQSTVVNQVSIFIDFFQDQTYTPRIITIRGGNTYRDIQELATVECGESVGWVDIDLSTDGKAFPIFALQVAILNTHSDGKDTQIRQIKLFTLERKYKTNSQNVLF